MENSNIKLFWHKERFLLLALVAGLLIGYSEYTSLIMGIAFIIVLLKYRLIPLYFDFESVSLVLTFVFFFVIYVVINENAFYWGLYYCATPVFMYMIGKYLASKWYDENCILIIMLLMAVGLGLPHLIVTVQDIIVNGLVNPERYLGILSDEENINVTLRAVALSLFCFGFALLPYKPLSPIQKKIKRIFIIVAILSVFCFLHYLSRSGLAFVLMIVALGILMSRRKGGNLFWVVLLMLITIYAMSESSVIVELTGLFSDRQSQDESIFEAGGRSERWKIAWQGLFTQPLGGVRDTMYAHNLWLDIGRISGVIPFVGFVLFSVSNTIKTIKIAFRSNNTQLIKVIAVGFTLLFLLSNFTECTIIGLTPYVFIYILFCGMMNVVYKKSVKTKR